jgi:pimeloyl-ACP methyl ester carboxylesterase
MSGLGKLAGILSTTAASAGVVAYVRYLAEMGAIRSAVEAGGILAQTSAGPIEYAEEGTGESLLLIHGAGGGYDQGLLVARDLGQNFRIVAPSRFGYLRTPVPADVSPAAQADAHAALLDHLRIDKVVVAGVSAGGPSAIELALRHPDRVSALILLVPRTYDPMNSVGVDESAPSQAVLRLIETSADFLYWLAMRTTRRAIVRFLGVPPEVEARASPEDRARVTDIMRSVLPLSRRVPGIAVDSSIELSPWPLERLQVPTLIVSAKDDLFKTLPGASFTAEHIRGSELKVLEDGGHLMVGHRELVRQWVTDFLRRRRSDGTQISAQKKVGSAAVAEPVA